MSAHKDFRLGLAFITLSAVLTIALLAFLIVTYGKLVMLVFAGLVVFLILLGVASDVRRAFRTTKRTRFPLAPDPEKSRIEHNGGWRGV